MNKKLRLNHQSKKSITIHSNQVVSSKNSSLSSVIFTKVNLRQHPLSCQKRTGKMEKTCLNLSRCRKNVQRTFQLTNARDMQTLTMHFEAARNLGETEVTSNLNFRMGVLYLSMVLIQTTQFFQKRCTLLLSTAQCRTRYIMTIELQRN